MVYGACSVARRGGVAWCAVRWYGVAWCGVVCGLGFGFGMGGKDYVNNMREQT